jgi:RNA polymerase sigma-70 factor (ECF subfamily)
MDIISCPDLPDGTHVSVSTSPYHEWDRSTHAMSESASSSLVDSDLTRSREGLLRACVTRLSEGSEDALGVIYDQTSSLVYSIALGMLGDRADAEEVTLDVYSQIWRGASSFRAERGTVTGWLITMTRSRAIDRLRTRRRTASETDVDSLQDKPTSAPSPEQSTITGEQQRRVRTALAALPTTQRQLIELACYGGYSHSELAEKMGLPLGTVKTRMRMGLTRMRELLAVGGHAQ